VALLSREDDIVDGTGNRRSVPMLTSSGFVPGCRLKSRGIFVGADLLSEPVALSPCVSVGRAVPMKMKRRTVAALLTMAATVRCSLSPRPPVQHTAESRHASVIKSAAPSAPYRVDIVYAGYGAARNGYFCAGSFIAPNWVITAAHCLSARTMPAEVKIAAGSARFLEITEGTAMQNAEHSLRAIDDLKKRGIRISLDDSGTGRSSLSYVKRFPIDILEIDQSFVRDVLTDPHSAAIATDIIAMARSLRLNVIAEGVELPEQVGSCAATDATRCRVTLSGS
jgi:hypothetical protein